MAEFNFSTLLNTHYCVQIKNKLLVNSGYHHSLWSMRSLSHLWLCDELSSEKDSHPARLGAREVCHVWCETSRLLKKTHIQAGIARGRGKGFWAEQAVAAGAWFWTYLDRRYAPVLVALNSRVFEESLCLRLPLACWLHVEHAVAVVLAVDRASSHVPSLDDNKFKFNIDKQLELVTCESLKVDVAGQTALESLSFSCSLCSGHFTVVSLCLVELKRLGKTSSAIARLTK